MARILVDTSAVYALVDRDDDNHGAAKTKLKSLKKIRGEPLLTNFLVAECHALLLSRLGAETARRWLLSNAWPVERITLADEERIREIIQTYVDKPFSYVDASSFAAMERLGLKRAFTFDRHFAQFGFDRL